MVRIYEPTFDSTLDSDPRNEEDTIFNKYAKHLQCSKCDLNSYLTKDGGAGKATSDGHRRLNLKCENRNCQKGTLLSKALKELLSKDGEINKDDLKADVESLHKLYNKTSQTTDQANKKTKVEEDIGMVRDKVTDDIVLCNMNNVSVNDKLTKMEEQLSSLLTRFEQQQTAIAGFFSYCQKSGKFQEQELLQWGSNLGIQLQQNQPNQMEKRPKVKTIHKSRVEEVSQEDLEIERDLRSIQQNDDPQTFHRIIMKFSSTRNENRKQRLARARKFFFTTGLNDSITDFTSFDRNKLEVYVCHARLPTFITAINKLKIVTYLHINPGDFSVIKDETVREKAESSAFKKLGFLLTHSKSTLHREAIINGYDNKIIQQAFEFEEDLRGRLGYPQIRSTGGSSNRDKTHKFVPLSMGLFTNNAIDNKSRSNLEVQQAQQTNQAYQNPILNHNSGNNETSSQHGAMGGGSQ
jgi:hypothetical protein